MYLAVFDLLGLIEPLKSRVMVFNLVRPIYCDPKIRVLGRRGFTSFHAISTIGSP